MRKSNAEGRLHKDALNPLIKQIEECFEHRLGPGSLPPKNNKLVNGILVPHDAYELAGPAMAWSYFSVGNPDVFVIFGTNHNNSKSCLMQEPTETPFGVVRVDQNLARDLIEKGNLIDSSEDFSSDKKIDLQLPFLQYLNMHQLEKVKILPILLSEDANISEISADIKEVLAEQNKKATFICVSNMTRYGTQYKYAPYVNEIRKNIYDADAKVLELIKKKEMEKLSAYIEENLMTIWGLSAIKLLIKLVNPKEVHLQQYYTSGDLNEVDNPSVAYAALVLE